MGGGTGPADGTRATTCTPAPTQMKLMLQSTDDLPLNFGFTGKVIFFFLFVLFVYNACSGHFLCGYFSIVFCSILCDGPPENLFIFLKSIN